jgi:hypothetical protein
VHGKGLGWPDGELWCRDMEPPASAAGGLGKY